LKKLDLTASVANALLAISVGACATTPLATEIAPTPPITTPAASPSLPSSARVGSHGASFAELDLYPNINTIGVVVSGDSLPATATLSIRKTSEADWHAAHPLMRIKDGRLVGSLFNLAAATPYSIKVSDGTNEISGSVTTQVDEFRFAPSAVVHVDASAAPGGDGSAQTPFQKIQDGLNHAKPGTQVLVAKGIYHETVTFGRSGTPGNWIQIKAEGGAILDGSKTLAGNVWTPLAGSDHIYFTSVAAPIAYLARDNLRFYAYDNRSGLDRGKGHGGVPMDEGWFYDTTASQLFVRSRDDPSTHIWHVPALDHAFEADAQDWLWIEGFEMRYYGVTYGGCGVCTKDASHLVIRHNNIHNLQVGVFVNWTGGDDRGNDSRIEYNDVSDPPAGAWPWKAVDGSSMEGTAIVVRGRTGAIVRGNRLHNIFNGIYVGSSAQLENSQLAFDTDIYNNAIQQIGDDGLEPEGACINSRFRDNTVDASLVGVSLAPVTQGPTWVIRSVLTNFHGRAFKWDRGSDGIVLIYHNTSWSTVADINAMDMISPVHNAVLRNNIFQSNGYGVYEVTTGSTGHDWNNDDWYTTRPSPHFIWENVAYGAISDLCAGTGLECEGYEDLPGFRNPAAGDFALLSSSPNVDRGVSIPGINDSFSGNAPDVGAIEHSSATASLSKSGRPDADRVVSRE
jgi:hypothetical protein